MDKNELNELIECVLRQTSMERYKVIEKLNEYNFDSIRVIKEHFEIKEKKIEDLINVNQQVYREIRGFMDKAAKQYRYTKELDNENNK